MASNGEHPLAPLFRPRSIALAGASSDPSSLAMNWLEVLTALQFRGPLYPVNPSLSEVAGLRCYPCLDEIPGPVDYVISCIPASGVPKLVEDCIRKGVKLLHLYTGRMADSGEPERIELEAHIGELARRGGLRVLGPNCMGLYYPAQRISYTFAFPREAGPVGYFAQSGSHTLDVVCKAALRGARFSKVVSFGNALDINECDLLEYFAQDPETRIIAIYIEGVKDGPRFLRLLKETTPKKPVLVHKGGRSEAGTRATLSHTAALAGSERVWSAMFRQVGAVQAYNSDDLADLIMTFLLLPPPRGRRVAVVGGAGGWAVQAADDCDLAGLTVQPLSPDIRRQIVELAPQTGFLLRNPVDTSAGANRQAMPSIIKLVAEWDQIDLIIALTSEWGLDRPRDRDAYVDSLGYLLDLRQHAPDKPLALVATATAGSEEWRWRNNAEKVARATQSGIPVYHHVSRAASALSRFCEYHEFLASRKAE